jgi:hypothetical protein
MNQIAKFLRILSLLIILSILVNCQAEKEKDFYGLGEEEIPLLLTGLILNRNFVDRLDGTVLDQFNRVLYRKCVSGQEYRREENDCRGIQRGSLFTPNDTILYGALTFGYCNINSWNCNSRDFPFPLVGNAGLTIPGESEAFNHCNKLNDATGAPGWRVATPIELRSLTLGGRNSMLQVFPDTPEDWFWSSWGRNDDIEGETALAVSFERSNFGEEKGFEKRGRKFIRCVRLLGAQE